MKIAYFDTFSGISGDMTLGAFLSAGVRLEDLRREIGRLNLPGVEIEAAHMVRNGITAVKAEVVISAPQTHHRHLRDILAIIEAGGLAQRVRDRAAGIFRTLAGAEAKVHGTSIDKVHFHEVGALDAIVDITGAAICLELLGIDAVYTSPVRLGSGAFITTEHGKLPLPGPATSEILSGYPTVLTDIPFELTTPTGASIVKTLSSGVLTSERFSVTAIGYGAGTYEIPQVPNLLRIMVGDLAADSEGDALVMIETNIDNMNPEIYPFVIEQLLSRGAHDAYLVPVVMKKGRPGMLLSVLTDRAHTKEVAGRIFAETTTLGVRIIPVERMKLERRTGEFQTAFGPMKAKIVTSGGQTRVAPEFEECRRIAQEKGIPLIEVYRLAEREMNPPEGRENSLKNT